MDKALGRELVDQASTWGLNRFIYETLTTREELNRKALKEEPSRQTLEDVTFGPVIQGPVWTHMTVTGQVPQCADERGLSCELRLFHREKRIDIIYSMRKKPVNTPEAVYVAFPFHWPDGQLRFEVQGGVVVPGRDQLAGTSSDWNTIQNYASVRSEEGQIVYVSEETPLVHFGDLNLGRYQHVSNPKYPHIYSWVLNNYWVTNFKSSQEGELKWGYSLTSTDDASNRFAARFGWGTRIPFRSRLIPAGSGKASDKLVPKTFLCIDAPNLLLVAAYPSRDQQGIVIHLRELDGEVTSLDLDRIVSQTRTRSINRVNALEETICPAGGQLSIQPYEAVFLKIMD
jgi:hypothetical protein